MKELQLHFLNTIWSDAMIISKDNHYGIIDTASSFYYPDLDEMIKELKIKVFDFMIITHWHHDHYGNAANIIRNYPVKKLYMKHYHGVDGSTSSGTMSNEEYLENERKAHQELVDEAIEHKLEIIYLDDLNLFETEIEFMGETIELYDLRNRLWDTYNDESSPYYHQYRFNQNYNSIGLFIKTEYQNIFLGADLTSSKLEMEDYSDLAIKIVKRIYEKHHIDHMDFYKVNHHACGANPKELTDLLKTKKALITNTARWLDTFDTIPNLKASNKKVKIYIADRYQYHFTFGKYITSKRKEKDSLFLVLGKN